MNYSELTAMAAADARIRANSRAIPAHPRRRPSLLARLRRSTPSSVPVAGGPALPAPRLRLVPSSPPECEPERA